MKFILSFIQADYHTLQTLPGIPISPAMFAKRKYWNEVGLTPALHAVSLFTIYANS
jgi:hypothetical protein